MSTATAPNIHEKPTYKMDAALIRENFPLVDAKRFICWDYRWKPATALKPGKWDKPPISPYTGRVCSATDESNWATLDEAIDAVERFNLTGIGFAFEGSIYCGIDCDGCIDPDTGAMREWGVPLFEELNTYTERSPGGDGAKAWVIANADTGHVKKPYISSDPDSELMIAPGGKYWTVTGMRIDDFNFDVERRQDVINRWLVDIFDLLKDCGPPPSFDDEPATKATGTAAGTGDVKAATIAMLSLNIKDGNDGSKRLFAYACRAVEHNLNDADAIKAIRAASVALPFPGKWSDAQILARLRDAEKTTTRGEAAVAAAVESIVFNAVSRCMADIEEKDLPWLWHGYVPDCNLTVASGRGGVGKGYWWSDFVARVSSTGEMPDGTFGKTGPVILVIAEDSHEYTVKSRLRVNGADLSNIHTIEGLRRVDEDGEELEIAFTLEHLAALEREVQRVKPALVVIDPIGSFIGGKTETNADNAVRAILSPLAAMADKYKFACVLIAHHRKSGSEAADDMVLSSRAFTAACRASFHIFDEDGRKLFLRGKGNLSRHRHGMAYRIDDVGDRAGRVVWESQPVEMDADDYLAELAKPGPDADARNDAVAWLREVLGSGSMTKTELQERRTKDGVPFSWRTAERAMKEAKVKCERDTFTNKWVYRLLRGADNKPTPLSEGDEVNDV